MAKKDTETPETIKTPVYYKEQFLKSKQYTAQQKDLLAALLEDGKKYTTAQVNESLNNFLKKEVK